MKIIYLRVIFLRNFDSYGVRYIVIIKICSLVVYYCIVAYTYVYIFISIYKINMVTIYECISDLVSMIPNSFLICLIIWKLYLKSLKSMLNSIPTLFQLEK